MRGIQLSIILRLPLQIHLLEHLQRALLLRDPGTPLRLHRAADLPPGFIALESERLAVVARGDDLGLAVPDQRGEGEELCGDVDHGVRGLVWAGGVDDRDGGVMRGEREGVPRGREGDGVHPPRSVVEVFAADGVEGEALAPDGRLGTLVDALDEAREDAGVRVGGARGEEDRVGVPVERGDGAADGLLEVFGHPPVVFFFEVADRDQPGAGADGEFLLVGRPAHEGGGAIDAQKDEGGFPARGGLFPDVGVAV